MAWARIEVSVADGQPDPAGNAAREELALAGLAAAAVRVHRIFWLEGVRDPERIARELLADPILEIGTTGEPQEGRGVPVSVWKKPGVMDPAEASVRRALRALDDPADRVVTARTFWVESDAPPERVRDAVARSLANEVIEEIGLGPPPPPRPLPRAVERVTTREVALEGDLVALSRELFLALDETEMRAIRDHFAALGRAPRLGELETIAQTWSEHCKHKTLTGPIDYVEDGRRERIDNLLKETIFAATRELGKDWCVSVFRDNAGVVRFSEENDLCFKVETHNHPSAIEPYGGAGTGIGGVIRDILGTGLGARPIANTDVFCFGELDQEPPRGALPPLRVMKGVVAGVRDYGNRMGIPTVNGAVCFDPRYAGNPIVYCGTVGLLPRGMHEKAARPGDLVVCAGGRTGRDGIHGATFSSETLHDESDAVSGGAVQIGNPIEEKRLLDVLLRARDRRLYTAITDCGAGGLSSAVGEMGAECGAEVDLSRVPLKYLGLDPVEIWISEAQERMVLAVPPQHEAELRALFAAEDVEAAVIGRFTGDGRLLVRHGDAVVVDLSMDFLHDGLPRTPRPASYSAPAALAPLPEPRGDLAEDLLAVLRHGNVCSKEWIVRQYDHEVQAGSAIKPLVGPEGRGPGDAAVVVPELGSRRGCVIACGVNPRTGDLDPHAMAMCAVDEAIRNAVAVGADPERIALLDNFSWGDCREPDALGAIVRAARGCRDASLLFGAPFVSGKDSLNNTFVSEGRKISIPHTLLVSALGIVEDVARCVTSDFKREGSRLVLVGATWAECGGAIWRGGGGPPPRVRADAPRVMRAVARAIRSGRVLACHDLSEGGLAAAAAEMAIGGGFGARIDASRVVVGEPVERLDVRLFSESASRFLLEVDGDPDLDVPHAVVGETLAEPVLDFGAFSVPLAAARRAFFHWEELL